MKALLISATIFLTALASAIVTFSEKVDDGYILTIGSNHYDPVGAVDDLGNALVRSCSAVSSPNHFSQTAKAISAHLQGFTKIGAPKLNLLITSKSWAIAEAEFEDGEPGSFLLHKLPHGYKTVSVWSGSNAPFRNGPAIRAMFRSAAPAAPVALIRCYEPLTPPFGRGNGS